MDNLKKLCSVLQEDVDGLILSSRENRRYCAGVDIAEGMAIVSKAGCIYLTDSRYLEAAKNRITGFEVLEVDGGSPYTTRLVQAIEALHIHNLGFEEERWSVGEYQNFQKATGILWTPYQAQISQFRASKDPQELALMRRAQAITDQTYCQLLEMIRPSMTEKELAAELIYRLYRNGADGLSFDPIVSIRPQHQYAPRRSVGAEAAKRGLCHHGLWLHGGRLLLRHDKNCSAGIRDRGYAAGL